MIVQYMPQAEEALFEIGLWVESKNTQGSGERFVFQLIKKISRFAIPGVSYQLCRNSMLKTLQLQCITIDDWVIAFNKDDDALIVHYIIHGAVL